MGGYCTRKIHVTGPLSKREYFAREVVSKRNNAYLSNLKTNSNHVSLLLTNTVSAANSNVQHAARFWSEKHFHTSLHFFINIHLTRIS